jgi:hypothetical protein
LHVTGLNGLPVAGAAVKLGTNSKRQMRPIPDDPDLTTYHSEWSTSTDAQGRATLAQLPPDVPLLPEGGTFPSRKTPPIVLEPGEMRDVEWKVDGGTLNGIVLDQHDEPVADCELWLKQCYSARPVYFDVQNCSQPDRRIRTDASGRFVIAMIHGGTWWLGPGLVQSGRKEIAPYAQIFEDNGGRLTQGLVLHVDRGLFVSGHVVPPVGKQLLDGVVVVEGRERMLSMTRPWNADGSFFVGPLLAGRCIVTARSSSGHAPSSSIEVEAGAKDVGLSLHTGATIRGRLLDETGVPAPGWIILNAREEGSSTRSLLRISTGGEFELKSVGPGRYALAAWGYGSKVAFFDSIDIAEGSEADVELRLSPAGLVRVQYLGSDRTCDVAVLKDGVEYSSDVLEWTSARTMTAPTGRVTVRALPSGSLRYIERSVEVEPGKTATVVIDAAGR